MIIKKVALKNIKSYGEDVIEFEEGITSIHGLNGAGKSTVLESIGYALFDSLPYNQAEFLRKGEKTGEVAITIIGADDIEYTVTRKCGSSIFYALRDQNGIQVEGKEDVGARLCEILGYRVPEIGQLRSLFENAVGVLQGTFVSEFLESAGKRKAIFDPLLRIDEYNTAHKNLLLLKNHVRESIDAMEKDVRYLEGKTAPLDQLKAEKEALAGHKAALQNESAMKKDLLGRVSAERSRLDAIEKEIRELESKRMVAATEAANKKAEIDRMLAELKNAEEAKKKLEQNEPAYKRYSAKTAEKDNLEKQRSERDDLLKKINAVNPVVAGLKIRLAECERSLKEMETYEAEIKALEPMAALQEKLETEAQRLRSELNTRDHELSQLKDRMKPLKTVKGSMCPILPDVECKNDLQGYFTNEMARIARMRADLEGRLKDVSEKVKNIKDPRLAISIKKESLKKQGQTKAEHGALQAQLIASESGQAELLSSISRYSSLESQFKALNEELRTLKPAYDEYQQNIRIAGLVAGRMKDLEKATEALEKKSGELKALTASLEEKKAAYDARSHGEAKASCDSLAAEVASLDARIGSEAGRLGAIDRDLAAIEELRKDMANLTEKLAVEADYLAFVERTREIIRMAGPDVIRVFIDLISREATAMYCEIAGDMRFGIRWTADYDIVLIEEGRERTFRQLSGGEQMSAALAVRLAILKILTSSDVVFLDEPTQNLDESRRERLAMEIMRIKDFRQMVIISHDDTFNAALENVIEIEKVNGESRVRRRNGHARPQATLP